MSDTYFEGELVTLRMLDPETDSASLALWQRDALYDRNSDTEPAMMFHKGQMKEWLEKRIDRFSEFVILRKSDKELIGFIELAGFDWHSGNAWLGIGIGERENWGKGYGTEAINLLLRFAFQEWNLHRVTLAVNAYNKRAVRSYEKAGFMLEGSLRNYVKRDGQRWDMHMMGLLRKDWEKLNETQENA